MKASSGKAAAAFGQRDNYSWNHRGKSRVLTAGLCFATICAQHSCPFRIQAIVLGTFGGPGTGWLLGGPGGMVVAEAARVSWLFLLMLHRPWPEPWPDSLWPALHCQSAVYP